MPLTPFPRVRFPKPVSSAVVRYTIAIASVGGAVLLMLLLRELGAGDDVRPALLVAVAISALYGGFGPGALALGLATLVGRDPVVLVTGA
ncbi:MAG TPA: hypothetical protein VE282_06990, partial [Gemmatimonadales bacterium]|nr:hypothetical protein [Gemmatimonadales bacterium]